jgi:hypothetical protein
MKWAAGSIPVWLKCCFVVQDAELSIEELLLLVHTFATVLMVQMAGMGIVEERHHPPMKPLHDTSYSPNGFVVS